MQICDEAFRWCLGKITEKRAAAGLQLKVTKTVQGVTTTVPIKNPNLIIQNVFNSTFIYSSLDNGNDQSLLAFVGVFLIKTHL